MKTSDQIQHRPYGPGVSLVSCPRCKSEYLHQLAVTVFDRGEDQATCVKTTIAGGKVSVDPAGSNEGNPSRRRDGLTIQFECEECGKEPIFLTIAQHKGCTEIGWRYENF